MPDGLFPLEALQPYVFRAPDMLHRFSQRGKGAGHFPVQDLIVERQQQLDELFIGPGIVPGGAEQ
jgi:hypothetical protein